MTNGTLIMAANALGESSDIPARSLESLRNSDLVVFEEARGARKALKAAGIHREFVVFNEHRDKQALNDISETLRAGKSVAYMSDQGMPTICDPGTELVRIADNLGAKIKVIPGPCSVTAALSACPFYEDTYFFAGFLPKDRSDREKMLKKLMKTEATLVILDTPYRRQALLESCCTIFGNQHQVTLAIDISGENEAYITGEAGSVLKQAESLPKKINFALCIAPSA